MVEFKGEGFSELASGCLQWRSTAVLAYNALCSLGRCSLYDLRPQPGYPDQPDVGT